MLYSILKDPSDIDIYLPIIKDFWPGPLTILIPKSDLIPLNVTGGNNTVAVRMPNHPIALQLIDACGFPLAAPSANTSGRPSPTTSQHVHKDLSDRIPMIVEGGSCSFGIDSTVLDALHCPPTILRPGSVTLEQLRQYPGMQDLVVYKTKLKEQEGMIEAPATPGMKYRHYTPDAKVVLFEPCSCKEKQRILLDKFRNEFKESKVGVLRTEKELELSEFDLFLGKTDTEIASNLFQSLLALEHKVDVILVEGIKEQGVGLGIMNRLGKAASQIVSDE